MKAFLIVAVTAMALTGTSFIIMSPVEKNKLPTVNSFKAADMFDFFRAHRQAKGVMLDWGITSQAGVNGFSVERSYDGEFYDPIILVGCASSLKYNWKDNFVFPGYIYYRIGCMMNDGTTHYSAVEVVRIVAH